MLRSMKAKHVRMVIAGLSLIVSIIILGTIPTWVEREKCWEICVWKHVCLLQIVGGLCLFLGSIKSNQWLFLPWLVSACIFIYTLLYKSVLYYFHLEDRILMVVPLFQTIAGFWCYFVFDVFQDFLLCHGQGNHINLSN
ncbi:hypothetical protein KR200_010442 [Drosophila serrata]|nr:hypothetical protein KR200_010442 [Drosophila serrata]